MLTVMITDNTLIKNAMATVCSTTGLLVSPSQKQPGGFLPACPDGLIVISGNEGATFRESLGAALSDLDSLRPYQMDIVIRGYAETLTEVDLLQAFILERCHPATRCNILFEFTRRDTPSASIFISRQEHKMTREKVVCRPRRASGTGFLDLFWTRIEKKALEVYESRNAPV